MSHPSGRKGEFWFILLIATAFILIFYFGSDLTRWIQPAHTGKWDPITPILNGLSGLGQAITHTFSRMLP